MEIEAIGSILKEVEFKIGTLKEARSRFADRLAPDFNIFDYLRTDEMGLSTCLADLLDPKGPHGQGRVFLDEFMRIIQEDITSTNNIPSPADWLNDLSQTPKVTTEKPIDDDESSGKRRIDIYLDFNHGVIGIENKPWAEDQPRQLIAYARFLEKVAERKQKKKNWLLIFLSDREPSADSILEEDRGNFEANGNYVQLSYSKLIGWLDFCSSKSKALAVRVFIEELSKFVRTRVIGAMDMTEVNEVRDLILTGKDNKLEAAFSIRGAINAVKIELLKKFLKDLKDELDVSGLVLVYDLEKLCGMKAYAGFEVKKDNGQDMNLCFSFDNRDLNSFVWGIVDRSSKKDDAKWRAVNKLMNDEFTDGQVSKAWPWWVSSKKNDFDNIDVSHWENSPAPWQAIQDGKLAPAIASLSNKVYSVFNDKEKMDLLKP